MSKTTQFYNGNGIKVALYRAVHEYINELTATEKERFTARMIAMGIRQTPLRPHPSVEQVAAILAACEKAGCGIQTIEKRSGIFTLNGVSDPDKHAAYFKTFAGKGRMKREAAALVPAASAPPPVTVVGVDERWRVLVELPDGRFLIHMPDGRVLMGEVL
jgi:hypothetical protein